MTVLDPERDEARRLLEHELTGAEYNRPESFLVKGLTWILERISGLIDFLPGSNGLSTLLLGVVAGLVAVAVVFAVRGTRRSSRLTAGDPGAVLTEAGLSAEDYRSRAADAARRGDWDTVLLDSYRAIAASTDERALLDEVPGTTAHEIALGLRLPFPDRADDLLGAANGFDAVCYGGRHASREQAEAVRELDRVLVRTRPARVHQ